MRSLLSFLAGGGVSAACFLWPRSERAEPRDALAGLSAATLERITLVLVETQRDHHARVRALFDVPDFDSPERGERLMAGQRQAGKDLFARQRALLEPPVRPDVFEEAYLKFSGQWEGPTESP